MSSSHAVDGNLDKCLGLVAEIIAYDFALTLVTGRPILCPSLSLLQINSRPYDYVRFRRDVYDQLHGSFTL